MCNIGKNLLNITYADCILATRWIKFADDTTVVIRVLNTDVIIENVCIRIIYRCSYINHRFQCNALKHRTERYDEIGAKFCISLLENSTETCNRAPCEIYLRWKHFPLRCVNQLARCQRHELLEDMCIVVAVPLSTTYTCCFCQQRLPVSTNYSW